MAIVTDENELEDWKKAGRIAAQARDYGAKLIVKGAKLIDVSDAVEKKILELGGQMAFPAQISCNHIAAHYCAKHEDETVFENQLASLDVGVHINGCIGDTAVTVDLSGENAKLVEASRAALNAAIVMIKAGVTLGEVGRAIHKEITAQGFAPVVNLSGHGLEKYTVHAKPSIPNYDTGENTPLVENQIVAIEPFATTGKGMIEEGADADIFSLEKKKPIRNPFARDILKEIARYNGLPFTTRWLTRKFPLMKVGNGLGELMRQKIIKSYPPLVEVANGLVSQAEHTVLVTKEGCEILTK